MIRDNLGETIDIHAGGADLIFPHHENEIAQSEAVTGKPLSSYWLHTAMVKIGGEKMSKSLGNFITIRDLLDRPIDPMVVRLLVLQAHYRKPIDFSDDALESATNSWNTLKEGLLFSHQYASQLGWTTSSPLPIAPNPQRGPRVPHSPLPLIPKGGPEFPTPHSLLSREL
jgi:cysteinyl-tRNA synthetase